MENRINEPNCDIIDIAHWFLTKESMSHKKLQKLCYYAVAWHYALLDSPLCTEDRVEAWIHGATSPYLYKVYKKYEYKKIPIYPEKPSCIDKETDDFLESVYITYGKSSEFELEALNHNEEPFKQARKDLGMLDLCHNKISIPSMKRYYRKIYTGSNIICKRE